MNRTRRAQVLPDQQTRGWWQWDCGWSGCTAGEAERTQRAAIDAVTRHSRTHVEFGFRPSGGASGRPRRDPDVHGGLARNAR